MSNERRQILEMLSEGKITADEAERLLAAIETGPAEQPKTAPPAATAVVAKKRPKYLCVRIEDKGGEKNERVNVRVPLGLVRAGMKFKGLMPDHAAAKVEAALEGKGIEADLSAMSADDLEELLEHLGELTVDIDDEKGSTVRVYCE
ncbi:hypothetical protein KQI84_08075 [bacterium]|nr:hypothetical protein [bacterium]